DRVAALVFQDPAGRRWVPALVAGLLVGLGAGLRLDSIFILPALALPLVLAAPVRRRALGALGAGLVPGFVLLSLVNQSKFGTFNPLTYGIGGTGTSSRLGHYLPAALLGLGLCLVLVLWRRSVDGRLRRAGDAPLGVADLMGDWRPWLAVVLTAAALAAALAPDRVGKIAHGLFQIAVDMRTRPEIQEPALFRSPGGAMVYMGGVKKSLLQSCPYLVMLYVPLIAAWRGHRHGTRLLFLLFLPAPFIGVFGSLAWHGSVALNMRYLNPILPWTSILVAWVWFRLEQRPGTGRAWTFAGVTFIALFFAFAGPKAMPSQELLFLTLPLVIALGLVTLELFARFSKASLSDRLLPWGLLFAFAFSGALTFSRDYPTSAREREQFMEVTRFIQPHLESPALLFSDGADIMWGLLDQVDDIYLARPTNDAYASFVSLVRTHRGDGRRAYLLLPKSVIPVMTQRLADVRLGMRGVVEVPPHPRHGELVLVEILSLEESLRLRGAAGSGPGV
ncbi:MAG: hypothetical protein AAGF23_24585, partial [Acidobacteriota bacterium]